VRDSVADGSEADARLTSARGFGQSPGGSQQKLPVFRRAFAVQPQYRKFIAALDLTWRGFVVAVHQMFDPYTQGRGNARQVRRYLTRTPGFPLSYRAAGYADRRGQLILRPALIFPRGADARADVSRIAAHGDRLGELS
jgi:hypothetical protein